MDAGRPQGCGKSGRDQREVSEASGALVPSVRGGALDVGQVLAWGRQTLQGKSEYPARDAAVLLAHAMGCSTSDLYLHPEKHVTQAQFDEYSSLIARRALKEPISYLTGYKEFMGLKFKVDARVLIPRPETEILVETCLSVIEDMLRDMVRNMMRGTADDTPDDTSDHTVDDTSDDTPDHTADDMLDDTPHHTTDDTPHHMLDDTPAAPGDTPRVPSPRPLTVADVCCGSGAIGLSILKHLPEVFAKAGVKPSPDGRAPCHEHITVGVGVQPGLGGPPRRHEGTAIPPVRLVLTDISPDALDVARQNAERLGLLGQVEFLLGDGLEPLRQQGLRGKIDLIASNPPYIPTGVISSLDEEVRCYEPHLALDGGNDGMDFVESLISQAPSLLAPGGYLIMEIGHDQADKCRRLLAEAQHKAMISRRSGSSGSEDEDTVEPLLWKDWRFIKDYAGIERILVARAAGSCS